METKELTREEIYHLINLENKVVTLKCQMHDNRIEENEIYLTEMDTPVEFRDSYYSVYVDDNKLYVNDGSDDVAEFNWGEPDEKFKVQIYDGWEEIPFNIYQFENMYDFRHFFDDITTNESYLNGIQDVFLKMSKKDDWEKIEKVSMVNSETYVTLITSDSAYLVKNENLYVKIQNKE